jgi:signal transduction histidine kinase
MKGLMLSVLLMLAAGLAGHGNALSQPLIVFSNTQETLPIGNAISILEDRTGKLSLPQVLSSNLFRPSSQQVPNLKITPHVYWVKVWVQNRSTLPTLLLELAYPTIDEVVFYSPTSGGAYKAEEMGERLPFWQRKYNHQNYIFDLEIPHNQTRTFYIRIHSGEQIQLPLRLGSQQSIFENNIKGELISGLYFGIILVMFFYNLFLYFVIKDRIYLYYVFYILTVGLTQACLQGYTYKYLWPGLPWLAIQSTYLIPICSGWGVAFFVRHFLHTAQYTPRLDKGLNLFIVLYAICAVLSLLQYYNLSQELIQLNAMLGSLYTLWIGYAIARQGIRPAKIFLLAWSFFLAGICIFVLRNFNILPFNTFTYYIMQIGSAAEVVLLSFALADRINILKREKEASQVQALDILKENERIIKEQNAMLDTKVKERTRELQESNRELNVTLKRLREAQAQLVNAEKMASVGQLTAGIAHEINNPINFVSAAMKPLRRNISYFLEVLDKYEHTSLRPEVHSFFKEADSLKKRYDIDYCKEEIGIILQGIEDGASRTTEIVKGLRNFSRLDEAEIKLANVNAGLDSTIILLQGNINGRIKINKQYGDIPEVECYAGKLNQVFMNILTNGIQAIQAKGLPPGEGSITVQTRHTQKDLIISFIDNGIGMSEEVKNKIFDPFFTTKDVGEGTGLGMSIVYSIIQMHEGSIALDSTEGVGTHITLTIPKSCVAAEKQT